MSRSVTGFNLGTRTVRRQDTFTKLDFIKTKLVFKMLMLGAFVVMLSLFYIWSRTQIVQIGYEINEHKAIQVDVLNQNKNLKMELGLLKNPQRIERFAKKLNLHEPKPGQIIAIE